MNGEVNPAGSVPAIYFDYSDLLLYFRHNRFPTGIQRVQIELFKASLAEWSTGQGLPPLRPCAFSHNAGFWVEVDVPGFLRLCELSSKPGSRSDPDWQMATSHFYPRLDARRPCAFTPGSVLLVAGPTWWIANYMPLIREAKALYGIRYVPLLYDFIPMLLPDLVDQNVAPAFNNWIGSVFEHADLLAMISRCTRDDAVAVLGKPHRLAQAPVVVPLDATFSSATDLPPPDRRRRLLSQFGLAPGNFVLFVGTLEARKNHRLVFQAWAQLVAQNEDMPMLVCVGKQGWSFASAQAVLDSQHGLLDKVMMLSGISDAELQTLYGDCLFTVYASLYEGWGLPVTESLCFGKACLTANVSSLPEAGGPFADYYEPGSVTSFVDRARRLIVDKPYRQSREALIAEQFRPRTWTQVLAGFVADIVRCVPDPAEPGPLVPVLEPGIIYETVSRPGLTWPDRIAAQTEMLCVAEDWFAFEPGGVWARQQRARLNVRTPTTPADDDLVLQIKVYTSHEPVNLMVKVAGQLIEQVRLPAHGHSLLTLYVLSSALRERADQQSHVTVFLEVDHLVELNMYTPGDHRRIGIGLQFVAIHWLSDIQSRLGILEYYAGMTNRA